MRDIIYRSPLFSLSLSACLPSSSGAAVWTATIHCVFSVFQTRILLFRILSLRRSRFCGSEESTACSKFKSRGERKRSEPLGFTSNGGGGGGGYSPVLRRQQSLSKSERGKQVASCKRVHYYSCVGGHVILSSPLSRHPSHPRDHDH